MRLIDADALVARCGDYYVEEGPEDGFIGTLKCLVDMQPTIGDWISVKDDLPKEHDSIFANHTHDFVHNENCMGDMAQDALELLKDQQETIASLQGTICKLNAALAEQPKQKFFVDSNGKITPLPIQKHAHWISVPDKSPKTTTINMYSFICSCSECGQSVGHHIEYNYCPRCGAKMDEEVKQDG